MEKESQENNIHLGAMSRAEFIKATQNLPETNSIQTVIYTDTAIPIAESIYNIKLKSSKWLAIKRKIRRIIFHLFRLDKLKEEPATFNIQQKSKKLNSHKIIIRNGNKIIKEFTVRGEVFEKKPYKNLFEEMEIK